MLRVHKIKGEARVGKWVFDNTIGSRVIVDFGAGDFNYVYAAASTNRIGIEIHKPSVDEAISHNPPGLQIFLADMRKYEEFIPKEDCDCAMMIDTLEHITREDGDLLLSKMQKSFNKIIIFMPCGPHYQEAHADNEHQEHKSTWYDTDLIDLGFSVEIDPSFHEKYKENGNMAAMYAVWEKKLPMVMDVLSQFKSPIIKQYRVDKYTNSTPKSVSVCASSPISNRAVVCEDGWVEERDESEIYFYFENEQELFNLHCRYNSWLADRGYFDFDPATINFFKPSNVYFDKSAVMLISDIEDKHIDCYFILLKQSYNTIGEDRQQEIRAALETRDKEIIRNVFYAN